MAEPGLQVRFFRLDSGREPVRDWLRGLDRDARRTIGEDVKTVQLAWPLGMPLVRKLDAQLWEIRSVIRAGSARTIFTLRSGAIVLLHGFVKKTRRTPESDLQLAKRRLRVLLGG